VRYARGVQNPPAAGRVALVLAVAIAAVSVAGTLVRLAPGASPVALAFWRVLLAAAVTLPFARRMSRHDVMLTVLGGLFLALHFWAWFASLGLTSVMRSTLLVCLTPIWAGVMEGVILRQAPGPRFWGGIAVAVSGVALMTGGLGEGGWTGDALALLGGVLGAAYFTTGRLVRARVTIWTYAPYSCLATAFWLGILSLGRGSSLALDGPGWWVALGLAAGPQLLGHAGFNYAVGRLPAAIVASVILLEPVGAAIVAALVLGEVPGPREIAGAAVTIAGVAVAARR